jgi:hypothetical protein
VAASGDGLRGQEEPERGAPSFTGRPLSRRFEHRAVVIEAGESLADRAPMWAATFVGGSQRMT